MNKTVGVLGCGWLGLPLAADLVAAGYRVKGSSTRPGKLAELTARGIEPFLLELGPAGFRGDIAGFLKGLDVLVFNIPPGLRKNPDNDYVGQVRHLMLAVRKAGLPRLIFVSSTSVYGRLQGVVDENVLPEPDTASGRQLLEAEALAWHDHVGRSTLIVRLGGLLGPDRHPATMLSGRTDLKGGKDPVNLIRRHEAVHLLMLALERSDWEGLVNAVHPEHPGKASFYGREARRLGLEPPSYTDQVAETPAKTVVSRYARELRPIFDPSIFG